MTGREGGPQRDLCRNRQAFHLYEILERFEAGVALRGFEVKSVRLGHADLKDAYAAVEKGEIWLHLCRITPYAQHTHVTLTPPDPARKRKLLMHKKEIQRLQGKVEEKGLTLVALRLYVKGGKIKVELGLGRGKRLYDKREAIKKRDVERETERALRERR